MPPQRHTIGIVGTGTMGSGIAQAAAQAGYSVVFQNRREASVTQAVKRIRQGLERLVAKEKLGKVECEETIRQCRLRWSILRLAAVTPIHLQAQDPSIMFEFSPDARFEFLHPADAGTAFARAVACEETIGKILNIAGGEKCRTTYYEFCSDLMRAIGIGPVPTDAFVRTEVRRFFGDWLDTEESQRLLDYQRRGLSEQQEDMRRDFGPLVALIRLLRPVATWYVTRSSPYLKENRRRTSS